MPAWFKQHGYSTVSVGKVSHHPGGRGGPDWNQNDLPELPNSWDRHLLPAGDWKHPRGWMHGLAHGEIRNNAKDMDVFQSLEGEDAIYPDGVSTNEALKQLELLAADDQPFFLAFGILRPHLPFGAPAKYMQPYADAELPPISSPTKPDFRTTWHGSGEFMKYNRWKRDPNHDADFAIQVRKHYAACVSYADAQVGQILKRLQEVGASNNTIVVLWGDHGWHLGEHAIWGKHALFEESLLSPLIIRCPDSLTSITSESRGQGSSAVTETIDIFPTLCELAQLPVPEAAQGRSLIPVLNDPNAEGHVAVSYFKKARTIRSQTHRLIAHNDGYNELYNHDIDPHETQNIAESESAIVRDLIENLNARRPLID